MSSAVKCSECKYWVESMKYKKDNRRRGECRRSEPHLGPEGYGYWPMTAYNEFCFVGEVETDERDLLVG